MVSLLCRVDFSPSIDVSCLHFSYSHCKSGILYFPRFWSTLTHFRSNSHFCFSGFSPYLVSQLHLSLFLRSSICLSKKSCPSQSTLTGFHRSIIGASFGKQVEESGIICDVAVSFYINVYVKANRVGSALLFFNAENATSTLQRKIHSQWVANGKGRDLIAICMECHRGGYEVLGVPIYLSHIARGAVHTF